MKPGQLTVTGLLLLLLGLEAVRNPNVKSFLTTWLGNFKNGVNSTGTGTAGK